MNVQKLLLFCFLSADLWDGHAVIVIHQRYSGDALKFSWSFPSNASIRFLCRNQCQQSDVLIRTDQNRHVSGRYSIEYQETGRNVIASISSLETSDSGRYRMGVGRFLVPDQFRDFELRVTGAEDPHNRINIYSEQEGGIISIASWFRYSRSTKFFCRNDCSNGQVLLRTTGDEAESGRYRIRSYQTPEKNAFTVVTTISQLKLSDSGLYSCGLGESLNSASFERFNILVTAVLFVVGGSVLIGGMLVVAVLLLYKLRKENQEIRNMESTNYENLRRDPNYQSLNPDGNNQERTYSTLRTPEDTETSC